MHNLIFSFVIVRHSAQVPLFYDKLVDHGRNRLEWINHLRYRGFHFSLLTQSWLYHLRHSSQEVTGSRAYQNSMIFENRESELSEKYQGHWMLPLCNIKTESHSSPSSMSVTKVIEKPGREKVKKLSRDEEIVRKFAKRREQLKNKKH